ncbi:MAG: helix-turn-helix domain-containing protein [Polyangiaceae bacterium]
MAARALGNGDVLGALRLVALREDATALALRGVAMAQLGELTRAKELFRRARLALPAREAVQRARVSLAEAEVALAARELAISRRAIEQAGETLRLAGDRGNVAFARVLEIQRLVLSGDVAEAVAQLSSLSLAGALPATVVRAELLHVEIASRLLDAPRARSALERARRAARRANIAALSLEIERASQTLAGPVLRMIVGGVEEPLRLDEVERVLASRSLVIDALRRKVGTSGELVTLARRPVLFSLLRTLGECFPGEGSRELLIARAFGAKRTDASHRARLRVEMARLRRAVSPFARVEATPAGFVLVPRRAKDVVVLAPPFDGENGAIRALLSDGQAWSSAAVAVALGMSQRTVQRILFALERDGHVVARGRARMRRWFAPPIAGFSTTLLLPGAFGFA